MMIVVWNATELVIALRDASTICNNDSVWLRSIILEHANALKVSGVRYSRNRWKRCIRERLKSKMSIANSQRRKHRFYFVLATLKGMTIGGMQLLELIIDAWNLSLTSQCMTCMCIVTKARSFQAFSPLHLVGEACMDAVTEIHRYNKCLCGAMNPYGSEGPSAHERREIKKDKRHGLFLYVSQQD